MIWLFHASTGKCDSVYYRTLKSKGLEAEVEEGERHRKGVSMLYVRKLHRLLIKAQILQCLPLWKSAELHE